jgi:hypothetical protein
MKYLTDKQKEFLFERTVKIGSRCMFPRFGFNVYATPSIEHGEYMDTNPFTKSLDKELFIVNDIVDGFCKGNFADSPKTSDFYLLKTDLTNRGLIEYLLLRVILWVPFVIRNKLTGFYK